MAKGTRRRGGFLFDIFKKGKTGLFNLKTIAKDPFKNFRKKQPVDYSRRKEEPTIDVGIVQRYAIHRIIELWAIPKGHNVTSIRRLSTTP